MMEKKSACVVKPDVKLVLFVDIGAISTILCVLALRKAIAATPGQSVSELYNCIDAVDVVKKKTDSTTHCL